MGPRRPCTAPPVSDGGGGGEDGDPVATRDR